MEQSKLSAVGKRLFSQIEFDNKERLVYEIRKHRFGLLLIELGGLFVGSIIFLTFVIGPAFISGDPLELGFDFTELRLPLILIGLLVTVLVIIMTAIGAYLYKSNVVLVTSEKIAQVLQPSIFNRKISQLSIGDVQDVTVTQKGILAHWLNYGTLIVETAGEQANYKFSYTPEPYVAAKAIVSVHEENLKEFGN